MQWTPDAVRALADRMERRLDRPVSAISADTLRLVVQALRHFAAEGFGEGAGRLVVEVWDLRRGTCGEVVGTLSSLDAAWAVFEVACRARPEARITLRKDGWVMRLHRPGDPA